MNYDFFQVLGVDPILKLNNIVGFGGANFKDVGTYV